MAEDMDLTPFHSQTEMPALRHRSSKQATPNHRCALVASLAIVFASVSCQQSMAQSLGVVAADEGAAAVTTTLTPPA
ncbi:MAG TPA: hypothetical protein VGM76_00735, partial [Lacipirellulaceae bacterium]